MARKGKAARSSELSEHPDYESLVTIDQVDQEHIKHKEMLVSKDFLERRIKEERKDYVSAMNRQLKEVTQEREHEMGILGALQDRKKQIHAAAATPIIPIRSRA